MLRETGGGQDPAGERGKRQRGGLQEHDPSQAGHQVRERLTDCQAATGGVKVRPGGHREDVGGQGGSGDCGGAQEGVCCGC